MAASKTPRSNSGDGVLRRPWWTALAKVKVCSAVSQSPEPVTGVKTGDAQGGRVGDSAGQFLFGCTVPQRLQQRVGNGLGLSAQQHQHQGLAASPRPTLTPPLVQGSRQRFKSALQNLN